MRRQAPQFPHALEAYFHIFQGKSTAAGGHFARNKRSVSVSFCRPYPPSLWLFLRLPVSGTQHPLPLMRLTPRIKLH